MMPRSAAKIFAACSLLLAACSSDPVREPVPRVEPDITVQHRDVDLLRFHETGNRQRVAFPMPVDRDGAPIPTMAAIVGDEKVYTGATIESRGTISPPSVDGLPVQLTDVQLETVGGSPLALAVANAAGAEARGAVQVFDLADPFEPVLRSEVLVADAEYASIAWIDGAAWALGNDAEGAVIDVFDLSDLDAPEHVQRVSLEGHVAVAWARDDASIFVGTASNGGVVRFDASEPFVPTQLDFRAVADLRDLARVDGRLAVLTGFGVEIWSDEGGSQAALLPGMPAEAPTRGRLVEDTWYVNTNAGLFAVDMNSAEARQIFRHEEGTANGVDSDGRALFFRANGEAGLQLLHRGSGGDVSDLGFLDLANAGSSNSVAADRDFLLSGDGRGGVLLAAFHYDVFEDFEGKQLQPYPWVDVYGKWEHVERDGSTRFTCPRANNPSDRRAFWGTNARWTDFQVDAKLLLDQGNGCGIYFRAKDVWRRDRQDAYIFQYDPGYDRGSFLFRKIRNGRESDPLAFTNKDEIPELADTPWYDVWRDVRIVVEGTRMRAWIDGVFVVEAEDEDFGSGSIGVRAWSDSQPWFDDFRVTEY